MHKNTIIVFYILLGISLASSVIFNDPSVRINWVYSEIPLLGAVLILVHAEMKYRSSNYS